jgi:hypothetical protein
MLRNVFDDMYVGLLDRGLRMELGMLKGDRESLIGGFFLDLVM